jgi:hypothetical protein
MGSLLSFVVLCPQETFFVRGEMFWGNDRLEDAFEFAMGVSPT